MSLTRRGFLGGGAALLVGGCRTTEWFGSPELAFGVVSDIHVTTPRSTAMFRKALRYFRRRGADAVVVPGDLTDWGLKSSLGYVADAWRDTFAGTSVVPLFCTGNHDWDGWRYADMTVEMHANGYSEDEHLTVFGMEACWREAFGEDFAPVRLRAVKGYSFVSSEWRGFSDFPEWMEKNGAALRGDRPFFYFQHPPAKGTTSDSGGWADKGAAFSALRNFPNAIAFTGHTHRPFDDDRSIWQGEFTAIATPSLSYASFPGGYENGRGMRDGTSRQAMPIIPVRRDCRGGQGYFVSVYADRMVVERIDIEEDCAEGAPAWIVPLGTTDRPMDLARRTAASRAPQFPSGAKVETYTRNTEDRSGRWIIALNCEFPSAEPERGGRVWDYEVKAVFADGRKPLARKFLPPSYARMARHEPARQRFWFDVTDLPEAVDFRLEVRASNCFGKRSKPIFSETLRTALGYGRAKRVCVVIDFATDAERKEAMPVLRRFGLDGTLDDGMGPLPAMHPVSIGPDMTRKAFAAKLAELVDGDMISAELHFRGVPPELLSEMMGELDALRRHDWVDVATHKAYRQWFGGKGGR